MMDSNESDQYFYCKYYAVAYFDILGQRKKLHELPLFPDDKSKRAAMPELLLETAKPILELRKVLTKIYNGLASLKSSSCNENERDFKSAELKFQPISDSFVAWVSLSTHNEKFSIFGLHSLLLSAGWAMLESLANGIVIRGAVEIGYGLELTKNELYGPALSRAYILESRCTNWPRITVGEGVIELWDKIFFLNTAGMIDQPNFRFATRDKSLTFVDVDGRIAVDYLGPAARSFIGPTIDGYQKAALKRVKHFQKKYRNDAEIHKKYDNVLHYFNSRIIRKSN